MVVTKRHYSWHFQSVVCLFCTLRSRVEEFRSNFDNFGFFEQNSNLNENLNISGNTDSTKKSDHILEMPSPGIVSRIKHDKVAVDD